METVDSFLQRYGMTMGAIGATIAILVSLTASVLLWEFGVFIAGGIASVILLVIGGAVQSDRYRR